ncbi:MAG: TfoX/Sxy family protein [Bacteroidales bacterium]|nr:TfoX/Sxy family protein [Bacteroidales bacterium]
MASNPDLVQYIADQCSGAGEIVMRKMFGDYGVYCRPQGSDDLLFFGLVSDNGFYIKPLEELRTLLREVDLRPPYEGAKQYYYIADLDDADYLSALVRAACAALPMPKPKAKRSKK